MIRTSTLAALALTLAAGASADSLHKCTDAEGHVTYSQTRCEGARDRIDVDAQRPREADQVRAQVRAIEATALADAISRQRALEREHLRAAQDRAARDQAWEKARAADAQRYADLPRSSGPPKRSRPIRTAPPKPPRPRPPPPR